MQAVFLIISLSPSILFKHVWLYSTSQANLNHISILQKKAIRVITVSSTFAHTDKLFIENRILPFEKIISFNRLLFMHTIAYKYANLSPICGKRMKLAKPVQS
jgi:hypothetical protein